MPTYVVSTFIAAAHRPGPGPEHVIEWSFPSGPGTDKRRFLLGSAWGIMVGVNDRLADLGYNEPGAVEQAMRAVVARDLSALRELGADEESNPWTWVDDYGGQHLS